MAKSAGCLTHWSDPVLGELVWDQANSVWTGSLSFVGRAVRLELDPDRKNPTRDEQLAVVEASRKTLAALEKVEPKLRRQAAREIAEAVASQGSRSRLPQRRFADTLELEIVSLHGCGELHYRSPEFFPGWRVTIYFDEDLSFGDAEVYE